MKKGQQLDAIQNQVTETNDQRRDYLADSNKLTLHSHTGDGVRLHPQALSGGEIVGHGGWGMSPLALKQLASRFGVPAKYSQRMLHDAPELFRANLARWMWHEPKRLLVRTVGGSSSSERKVEAILSDRYRRLDNGRVLSTVLPHVYASGAEVLSADLTNERLILKCVQKEAIGYVRPGDELFNGVIIENSEVGLGKFRITQFTCRGACENTMIFSQRNMASLERTHLGCKLQSNGHGIGSARSIVITGEESQSNSEFWHGAEKATEEAFSEQRFKSMIDSISESAERSISLDSDHFSWGAQRHFGFTENENLETMQSLNSEGDFTQYGFANAISAMSQTVASYDRATELEKTSGEVLQLNDDGWLKLMDAILDAALTVQLEKELAQASIPSG